MLDRAFRILAAFGPAAPALSLTSLSVRSEMPKSTTSRIVGKLAELGVLDRTDDEKFSAGLRMLDIASLAPRGQGLRATAVPRWAYLAVARWITGRSGPSGMSSSSKGGCPANRCWRILPRA
ncbi:helix-turn-helix domain-containing protein [Streptomyces sp. NPDC050704]|uniref:helix-turn-helix domain-containing protein n=1 Tax=Streptomyces sp. NPDC050704 TaxID=3157219 RepID=UPI0034161010